ncbi:MAG: 2-hydroxychromene-2-carboxylate isomerase [Myxococcota bacterium]|jgi:2-hydroxychromene-2-carboxylate isomerase
MSEPAPIRFHFDYISSNAYLAWLELPKLAAKYGRRIEPVPTLFAGLLGAHGQLGPAEIPAKAAWMFRNNLRKAALLGVPLVAPIHHPFNPLLSLRVSSAPDAAEDRARAITALFRAVWVDREHVSEPATVARVLDAAGLRGAELVGRAQAPAAKQRLRDDTDAAIARGVFGVPTMLVGDELFWGYDDFAFLDRHLAGDDPLAADAVARWAGKSSPSAMRPEALRARAKRA